MILIGQYTLAQMLEGAYQKDLCRIQKMTGLPYVETYPIYAEGRITGYSL